MAHKKGGGSTRNGRDSKSKRLGVKLYDGNAVRAGGIVVLWTAGAGAAAPSVELMTDAAPVAGPAVDAEQANPAVDPQASQPPPDGRVAVEAEVADATFSDEPSPDQADPEQIDAWIRDLRDDDIRFNANEALAHLIAAGEAAAPALERALWSDDAQQRQFAARALRKSRRSEVAERLQLLDLGRIEALLLQRVDVVRLAQQFQHIDQVASARDVRRWRRACLGERGPLRCTPNQHQRKAGETHAQHQESSQLLFAADLTQITQRRASVAGA